ncbi:MAG: AbrB family transcriptional regulator [Burkholderiaceae bacterium]
MSRSRVDVVLTAFGRDRHERLVVLRTLVVALAAGALFAALGSPLPWLIGPLLVTAGARLNGVALDSPHLLRGAGQWVIGAALGLYFTPQVITQLTGLWWAILCAMVLAWSLTLLFGWILRRWGGLDPATAFFAGAVGSATEMSIQGERHGGRFELIAAVHSVRVVIVVVGVPYVYKWLQLHGTDPYSASTLDVWWPGLLALILTSVALASWLGRWGFPNVWMMAPLVVAALASAVDAPPSALPRWFVIAGQLFIGMSLGVRFRPESMAHIKRIVPLVIISTAGLILLAAAAATALAWVVELPAATMILATSPGGIAEMSLTAKVLQLGVPVVTAFQVARMIAMVLTVGPIYRTLVQRWPARWGTPSGGPDMGRT